MENYNFANLEFSAAENLLEKLYSEKNIFIEAKNIQTEIEETKKIVLASEKKIKELISANVNKDELLDLKTYSKKMSARLHELAIKRNLTLGATSFNNEEDVDSEIEKLKFYIANLKQSEK